MNILVVEDDPRVSRFLDEALRAEGYQVSLASRASELANFISVGAPNFELAIFDRMLQNEDSLTQIKSFKLVFPRTRILVLSAINNSEQKAFALDNGADDYLAKPYSLVELTARLRALLRRPANSSGPPTLLQLGNMNIDLLSHQIMVDGKRLDLSNKEYKLLTCLAGRPGQVFNKYQLLDRVWDTQLDLESNVVESTILNLRRKLEAGQAKAQLFSRRNVGYWIEA